MSESVTELRAEVNRLKEEIKEAREEIRLTRAQLYDLNRLFNSTVSLARKLGLPANLDESIRKMQTAIHICNSLRLSIIALETASGPIGWLLAGVGIVTTIVTTGEFALELF